jgi:hypothetical protein
MALSAETKQLVSDSLDLALSIVGTIPNADVEEISALVAERVKAHDFSKQTDYFALPDQLNTVLKDGAEISGNATFKKVTLWVDKGVKIFDLFHHHE